MLSETVDGLAVRPDGIYIDGTSGMGGHSAEILKKLTSGKLVSIDQDPDAIAVLSERFRGNPNSIIIKGNFSEMDKLFLSAGFKKADGILLDIGVSSLQLDKTERGFSFHKDAPLDMRMSQEGQTAAELINSLPFSELVRIIFKFGEEKYAKSIARAIETARGIKPVETTGELAEIIKSAVPQKVRRDGHPARKTFQAIRIALNGELEKLSEGLDKAFELLSENGRLAVIDFHSIEDGIVKKKMASWCVGCVCPPDFPICICGKKPKARLITKKPVVPTDNEIKENMRSRSAKLRICEKLPNENIPG